jgi:hypothetical protein
VPPESERHEVAQRIVSPEYFEVLRAALLRGRTFNSHDWESSEPVAVINDAIAREYFAGEDPIGKRICIGDPGDKNPWRTIVGVVADEKPQKFSADRVGRAGQRVQTLGARSIALSFGGGARGAHGCRRESRRGSSLHRPASRGSGNSRPRGGLLGAEAAVRYMGTLLYAVRPADPTTLCIVSIALIVVAGLASLLPARRASRVDPLAALRNG